MENSQNIKKISVLEYFMPYFVFCVSFLIYGATMAPGIFWGDGIEICTASYLLAPLHPTGYPLTGLLLKLFMMIPIGTIPYRCNLFCGLTGALCSLILYHTLHFVFVRIYKRENEDFDIYQRLFTSLSAAGALLLASSKTVWFHAITTEVYIIHLFFLLVLINFGIRFVFAAEKARTEGKIPSLRYLYLYALILGISFSNHMMTICSTLPFLYLIFLYMKIIYEKNGNVRTIINPALRVLIKITLLSLAGISLYGILLIRANANPAMNWGDPKDIKSLLWTMSGGEFKSFRLLQEMPGKPFTFSTYIGFAGQRAMQMFFWFPMQWKTIGSNAQAAACGGLTLLIIISCLFGALSLFRGCRALIYFLLFSFPLTLFFIFAYNIPDIDGYFLSLFPIVLILLAAFAVRVFIKISKIEKFRHAENLSLLVLLLCLILFSVGIKKNNLSAGVNAESLGYRTLSACDFNSIVLTEADNDIYPLWYFQNVEKFRTDVTVIGTNFIRCDWYEKYFDKETINKFNLRIGGNRLMIGAEGFYYIILTELIWPNVDKCSIYGFLGHPLLKRDLKLVPVCNTLSEEEREEDKEHFLPQSVLYKYEKK